MLSAFDIASQVAGRQRSAESAVSECLQAIGARDNALNAFRSVDAAVATRQAADLDARISEGYSAGPLAGVPVALKDNICTAWGTTACGSKILADYHSPFNAHVVERLLAADALLIGKTTMDEFGMGSSTENSAFGAAHNPWCPDRVPGGSSGGSAVGVAADLVPAALGSDTGGSVRQPASFCGVVGVKPSYGRVSRFGLVAFGSSLDQIGPLAGDVRDAALLLGVIAGHDPRDSTSLQRDVPDYVAGLDQPPDKIRIGVAREYFEEGLDAQVRQAVQSAIAAYEGLGAEIIEINMPHLPFVISCYYVLATAEASSNLARYDGVHYGHRGAGERDIVGLYSASRSEGFGPEVKRRIMLGTYALSSGYYDAYYLKASKVRTLIKQDFEQAFEKVDVLASPTSPVPAFRFAERTADPLSMYLADIYTVSANLAGICAINLPCGLTSDGLPIGLQLQAPAFAEENMFRIAQLYQRHTAWRTQQVER